MLPVAFDVTGNERRRAGCKKRHCNDIHYGAIEEYLMTHYTHASPLKRNDREGNAVDIRVFFGDNSRFGRASHLLSVYGPEIELSLHRPGAAVARPWRCSQYALM